MTNHNKDTTKQTATATDEPDAHETALSNKTELAEFLAKTKFHTDPNPTA